ncbi:hypothetical protein F5X71_34710 [Nocardia brasiliensis]|uniref:Uncharacterized protein n=1 Tax=Nocardia brasiliensis TaxID=37326 RepID=A0A6G9Y0P8_NOCBR|nr:hypothetical protein [Nocardia brasiliensis]QIS06778.1 hypothetical protein F5X71_34710 [Nocardia brasiliensis]
MPEKKDPAVVALAATLPKIPHPGGKDLRLVMFDGAGPAVTEMVAEAIVHFLRTNKFMPKAKS